MFKMILQQQNYLYNLIKYHLIDYSWCTMIYNEEYPSTFYIFIP